MPDDSFLDILTVVSTALNEHRIPYAITGSIASSIHGQPVSSQNVDVLVWMIGEQALALSRDLDPRFYRSPDAMRDAVRRHGLANLIDTKTGLKVDLSVASNEPFFQSILRRRAAIPFGAGGPSFVTVSPEDVILRKLLWRRDSPSEKQWDNALSVARVQGARLDWPYLHDWATRLGIAQDLAALATQAES